MAQQRGTTRLAGVERAVETGMMAGMAAAATDRPSFYFYPQPMFAGLAVHLAIGGFFGILFVLLIHALRARGRVALAVGVLYGLAVAALMGLVVLPAAADLLAAGPQIGEAASIVGWPTFAAWHLVYGLGLGTWTMLRP
jgi:uncharacterized membrane protein YagU involved in acid resistance